MWTLHDHVDDVKAVSVTLIQILCVQSSLKLKCGEVALSAGAKHSNRTRNLLIKPQLNDIEMVRGFKYQCKIARDEWVMGIYCRREVSYKI